MNYKIIDKETFYRKDSYERFTKYTKASVSMTARLDVTNLIKRSKETDTKFYINFMYHLSKILNSRDDYKLGYLWESDELICYDKINPKHYVFLDDKEICVPCFTEYDEDYKTFYNRVLNDSSYVKEHGAQTDIGDTSNYFDASYISWFPCDSINIELPDGFFYFPPIVTWSNYQKEGDRYKMPVTFRMNHAAADGYQMAIMFKKLEEAINH